MAYPSLTASRSGPRVSKADALGRVVAIRRTIDGLAAVAASPAALDAIANAAAYARLAEERLRRQPGRIELDSILTWLSRIEFRLGTFTSIGQTGKILDVHTF